MPVCSAAPRASRDVTTSTRAVAASDAPAISANVLDRRQSLEDREPRHDTDLHGEPHQQEQYRQRDHSAERGATVSDQAEHGGTSERAHREDEETACGLVAVAEQVDDRSAKKPEDDDCEQ